jgi:hypothetical protein
VEEASGDSPSFWEESFYIARRQRCTYSQPPVTAFFKKKRGREEEESSSSESSYLSDHIDSDFEDVLTVDIFTQPNQNKHKYGN